MTTPTTAIPDELIVTAVPTLKVEAVAIPETLSCCDVKFVVLVTPRVLIPEILKALPTRLLDKVIVAIPAAPVAPVTESPVLKVN